MTAADWPTSADPLALVRHLRGAPRLSPSRWFRWAVGLPTPLPAAKVHQLLAAVCDLPPATADADQRTVRLMVRASLADGAALAALAHALAGAATPPLVGVVQDHLALLLLADDHDNPPLADAVRCLFGDPFHPVTDIATWRTATAVHIARGVETDSDWSRLPVLADALEDGGCDHAELLHHLRAGGRHQPGCHALDAVLGR